MDRTPNPTETPEPLPWHNAIATDGEQVVLLAAGDEVARMGLDEYERRRRVPRHDGITRVFVA